MTHSKIVEMALEKLKHTEHMAKVARDAAAKSLQLCEIDEQFRDDYEIHKRLAEKYEKDVNRLRERVDAFRVQHGC